MSSSDGGEVSGDGGARVSEVEQTREEAGEATKLSDGDGDDDLFATISVKEELDQESCDGNPIPETVDQILSEALFALASEEPILRGGSTKLELSPTGSSPNPSFGQVPNPNPNPNFDPNPNLNPKPDPDPEPNPRESGCCPEVSEKDSKEGLSALLVPIGEKKRKRTVSSSSSSSSEDESGSKDSSSCSSSPSSDLSSSSSSSSSSHGPSSSSSSSSDESASPGPDTNGALDSCDSALTWSSSSSSPLSSSSSSSSSSFSDSDGPQQRSSHCKRGRFCIGRR